MKNKFQEAVNAGFDALKIITPTICHELSKHGHTILLPNYILELITRLKISANTHLLQAEALSERRESLWKLSAEYKACALNLLSILYQNQLLGSTDINQFKALAESTYAELVNFGKYYLFMKLTEQNAADKLQAAIRKFQECRGLLETTPHDLLLNPEQKELESTHLLGLAWHRCGVVLLESDKFEDGISHLDVAASILETLKGHEKEFSACQLDLVAARQRQKVQRDKVIAEQLQIITQLKTTIAAVENSPTEKPNLLKYTIELAEIQHQYAANRKKAGYAQGVLELYKEARTNFASCLAAAPTDALKAKTFACELGLAETLSENAEAHYEARRYKEALEHYLQVMKILFPYIFNTGENSISKELNQCIVLLDTAKDMFRTAHHSYWKEKNKPAPPIKPGQFESALASIKRYDKFEALNKSLSYLPARDIALFGITSKAAGLTVRNYHAKTEAQAKIKAKSTRLANAIATRKAVVAIHSHQSALDNFEVVLPAGQINKDQSHENTSTSSALRK